MCQCVYVNSVKIETTELIYDTIAKCFLINATN